MKKLTVKQEKFACEFAANGNACESYRIAYDASRMSVKSVGRRAYELKLNPAVDGRIAELKQQALDNAEIKAIDVLKMWIKIATADPTELVQVHRVACASCAVDDNANRVPQPDCPVCRGQGVEQVYISDTRQLKESAKCLYAGVRRTKHGTEVLLRNQDAALNNIAKFLGMFTANRQETEKRKTIIPSFKGIDAVEAARIYQQIMQGD